MEAAEAFGFLFVVSMLTALETPAGLDFRAVGGAAVDLLVTVATVKAAETTAGAAVVLAVNSVVEVATVGFVEATAGVAGAARTAADDATDAPLAPRLKFAAKSVKSAALTKPPFHPPPL